jgi:hypothetical protein
MKNDRTSGVATVSLLSVDSELCCIFDIIILSYNYLLDGSNYNYQEILSVLFRAATSSTNYLGSAHLKEAKHLIINTFYEVKTLYKAELNESLVHYSKRNTLLFLKNLNEFFLR